MQDIGGMPNVDFTNRTAPKDNIYSPRMTVRYFKTLFLILQNNILQNYKKSMRVLCSGTLFPPVKTLFGFYLTILAIKLK